MEFIAKIEKNMIDINSVFSDTVSHGTFIMCNNIEQRDLLLSDLYILGYYDSTIKSSSKPCLYINKDKHDPNKGIYFYNKEDARSYNGHNIYHYVNASDIYSKVDINTIELDLDKLMLKLKT